MTYISLLQSHRHTFSHLLNVLFTTKMFTRNNIHFILSPFPEIQSCLRCLPPFNLDVRIEIVSAPATEGSFLRDYGSLGASLSAWYESLLQNVPPPRQKGKGAKTKGGTGRSRLAKKDWKCWTKGRDRRENVLKRWKFESPFRQSPSNNLNWSSTIIPPFECPPPSLVENKIVKRP